MNFKLSKSKLHSLFFTLILFFGVQDAIKAQVQVTNATGCTIIVYVGQYDVTTPNLCDFCPVNLPTATPIASGATVDIFGQDVCGEEAGFIAWQVAGQTGFGISTNPGLPFGCYPNFNGANCLAPTSAFWTSSGPGYVSAIIF